MKGNGHAVAHRDRAGLVEKEDVDVTGCFNRATARCQYILPNQSINAANPNGTEQSTDCSWNETDQQGNENRDADIDGILLTCRPFAVMSKCRKRENRKNEQHSQTDE